MKLTSRALLAAAALTVVLVVPVPARAAAAVGCGAVVTTSVTLTADIIDCPGDGLTVGKSGITIDLVHFTISGQFPGTETPGSVGIRIGGHDRVVIKGLPTDIWALKNNQIVGFETAVHLGKGAEKNTLKRLNLRGSRFGVALDRANHNRLENNSISFAGGERPELCEAGPDAEAGIALTGADHNTIVGNVAQLGLFGILLDRSDDNTIEANEAAPLWSDGNQCNGIALVRSKRNQLLRNTVANNVPYGIRVAQAASDDNVLNGNIAFQNGGDGILVQNRSTTLKDNQSTRNQGWGINSVSKVTASNNKAAENFGPGQCRNVTCKPTAPPV